MSVQNRAINLRLFESAKVEFLEKGYQNASLQDICKNAGVTTGALYKRYKGKEELFGAVVEPFIQMFNAFLEAEIKSEFEYLKQDQLETLWNDEIRILHIQRSMNFFYDNFDGMRLLLCCSQGTSYESFLHDFSAEMTNLTARFMSEARKQNSAIKLMDIEELHIFETAFCSAMFEPIIHNFSREKALTYCEKLSDFFNWKKVFGF